MLKKTLLLFSLIVLFGFVAPYDSSFSSTLCFSGERTAWTSQRFMWFAVGNVSQTFCGMTVLLFGCYWTFLLIQFTGRHQRLSNVHTLAFSLPQLAGCLSIVEVHFDDKRFLKRKKENKKEIICTFISHRFFFILEKTCSTHTSL